MPGGSAPQGEGMKHRTAIAAWSLAAIVLGDLLIACGSFWLAYWVRFRLGWLGPYLPNADRTQIYVLATPYVALVFWLTLKLAGLYRQRRGIYAVDELRHLLFGGLLALALLMASGFFVRGSEFSTKVALVMAALVLPGLLFWRGLMRLLQVRLRQAGVGQRRVVILGTGAMALRVAGIMREKPGLGYRVMGLVRENERRGARRLQGMPVLGSWKGLESLLPKVEADLLLVALPGARQAILAKVLFAMDLPGVELRMVNDLFSMVSSPMAVDEIFGIQVFALKRPPLDLWHNRFIKRAFDLALVIPGLLLISALLLGLALAVKLSSPGPVFYRQERLGRDNRPFGMLKFRSMRQDAEAASGPVWASKSDPRRTALGTFLRGTSLDELPQLINILLGQMSLVGPRPERPVFVERFAKDIPRYLARHRVQAGLTGWAQVNGWRGDTSIVERTRYDLYYIENWSLLMDLVILARTLLEVFEQTTAY
jgi:exopolysaccharide biosynthesis polyprenyl glycosylphosphotransferase